MSQPASDQDVSVFQSLSTAKSPEQGLDTLIEEWRNSFDGLFDDEPGDTASVHVKSTGIVSTWYGQAHEAHGTAWEQQHQEVAAELTLYYSRWPKGLLMERSSSVQPSSHLSKADFMPANIPDAMKSWFQITLQKPE